MIVKFRRCVSSARTIVQKAEKMVLMRRPVFRMRIAEQQIPAVFKISFYFALVSPAPGGPGRVRIQFPK